MDKSYFQDDTAYNEFKDSAWRAASDKVLGDTAFNIAKYTQNDDMENVFLQWFTNVLVKSWKKMVLALLI